MQQAQLMSLCTVPQSCMTLHNPAPEIFNLVGSSILGFQSFLLGLPPQTLALREAITQKPAPLSLRDRLMAGEVPGQGAGLSLPGAQSAGFAGPGSYPYWGSTPNPGAARSHRTKANPAFAPRPPDGGRSAMVRRGKEVPQGTAQPDLVEGQAEPKGWSGSGLPLSATVLSATRSCSGPATRACAAGNG